MRNKQEIYDEIDKANENQQNGTGFRMSYEEGVKAALEWVTGDVDCKPMDE